MVQKVGIFLANGTDFTSAADGKTVGSAEGFIFYFDPKND
jgi:hypothetical protein